MAAHSVLVGTGDLRWPHWTVSLTEKAHPYDLGRAPCGSSHQPEWCEEVVFDTRDRPETLTYPLVLDTGWTGRLG